tara:strand:+ start:603 stop:824 length:222 start_codon:yes stop_codon:yes gene_type:complete
MNKYQESRYFDDPSDAYELGKNWVISVPYHELSLIEQVKEVAKANNCKSTAQYVRRTLREKVTAHRQLQQVGL